MLYFEVVKSYANDISYIKYGDTANPIVLKVKCERNF